MNDMDIYEYCCMSFYRTIFMLTAARKKILATNKREYLSYDKYL